jgi:hypothetical protein
MFNPKGVEEEEGAGSTERASELSSLLLRGEKPAAAKSSSPFAS